MKKKVEYIVEDSTIAVLLGIQNFTNKESAILELIKNAFDAKANTVKIIFENDSVFIIDDGIGMNENEILKNWMHVGKSKKEYEIKDKNGEKRILSGEKGIGRFALARLGDSVIIKTKKN